MVWIRTGKGENGSFHMRRKVHENPKVFVGAKRLRIAKCQTSEQKITVKIDSDFYLLIGSLPIFTIFINIGSSEPRDGTVRPVFGHDPYFSPLVSPKKPLLETPAHPSFVFLFLV